MPDKYRDRGTIALWFVIMLSVGDGCWAEGLVYRGVTVAAVIKPVADRERDFLRDWGEIEIPVNQSREGSARAGRWRTIRKAAADLPLHIPRW